MNSYSFDMFGFRSSRFFIDYSMLFIAMLIATNSYSFSKLDFRLLRHFSDCSKVSIKAIIITAISSYSFSKLGYH